MKIQFDPNQEYQLDAIKSVVDVFQGQPLQTDDLTVTIQDTAKQAQLLSDIIVANQLIISDEQILRNTWNIQKRNKVKLAETSGGGISLPTTLPASFASGKLKAGNNFTVEMETGTGKTYVYLRTIHELYKTYGFKKFIIVVPSVAIKEGVLKNLKITKEHFASIYNNPKMDYYVWDPKKRGQARSFATNDSLQIFVITIDSFTRSENIIHQQSDWGVPIEYIQNTNPVVIVDEPQNMESEKRNQAIESLHPLCTLRYSATHKNHYNMLYTLDPVKAYDLGLVKKIEVDSVLSEDAFNSAYLHLLKIERNGKSGLQAIVEVDKDDARGLQRQTLRLNPDDDLLTITGREIYRGFILDRIDAEAQIIEFANGKTFYVGQRSEALQEEIIKFQIQRTIENHFEKEKKLKPLGIKVLSLFFIDRVANYREYTNKGTAKGKFAKWFEEAYQSVQLKPRFKQVLDYDAEAVHNGYFSADKDGTWKDTKGDIQLDNNTYELIMKDKERLLNHEEPLRFIFTHSALREGWDNPNVFQICTLNETHTETRKRQEIGRGLRLPVNEEGIRIYDDSINILTVIANESFEKFAKTLQSEIEEETGVEFGGRINNKKARKHVRLRKNYALDENFQAIWNRIKNKTHYRVTFETDNLIIQTAKILQDITINQPRISSIRARINIEREGVAPTIRDSSGLSLIHI